MAKHFDIMIKVGSQLKREFGMGCFLQLKQIFERLSIPLETTIGHTKFLYFNHLMSDLFKNLPENQSQEICEDLWPDFTFQRKLQ